MGYCLSKCIPDSVMASELEAEQDEIYFNSLSGSNFSNNTTSTSFGSALLSEDEVTCIYPEIGRGACGIVFKGSYRGSVVAVKQISLNSSIEQCLDAVNTIQILSLRHPNIVLFMGFYVQQNYLWIVSEYCTRGSICDVFSIRKSFSLHCKPLKWILKIRLALGVARGLLYLHSAIPPLVHCDLKSANILVDDSWNTKVADFGIRSITETVGSFRLKPEKQNCLALKRWTAPEILISERQNEYSEASDIYSFGMIMWELTTEVVPFLEFSNDEEFLQALLKGYSPPIPTPIEDFDSEWNNLMLKAISPSPNDRPKANYLVEQIELFKQKYNKEN